MSRRRLRRAAVAAIIACTAVSPAAHAFSPPGTVTSTGDGTFYYRMGGGRPFGDLPASQNATFAINPANMLRLPQACSSMDAMASIAQILNLVSNAADEAEAIMIYAAQQAIAALPAIILQRASPGLYEHFMEALRKARLIVDVAAKSCEAIVEDAKDGNNPFEDWIKISRRETMKAQTGGGGGPVEAKQTVDATNGDEGVAWLTGRAGGQGQPPITVITDTVRAGYNILVGRQPNADGAPDGAAAGMAMVKQWPTPDAAAAWAVSVIGDDEIRTCQGCDVAVSHPGVGLVPDYDKTRTDLEPKLHQVLDADTAPTLEQLLAISPPDLLITSQMVSEIRQQFPDPQDRELLVVRLAADVAATKTVESALMIRRCLLTGRGVPEIGNLKPAVERIRHGVFEFDQEITMLMAEKEFREKNMARTALTVLAEAANRRQQSLSAAQPVGQAGKPFIGGGVR